MVPAFLYGISPKVKLMTQLGIELTYFKTAVQSFRHHTQKTLHILQYQKLKRWNKRYLHTLKTTFLLSEISIGLFRLL